MLPGLDTQGHSTRGVVGVQGGPVGLGVKRVVRFVCDGRDRNDHGRWWPLRWVWERDGQLSDTLQDDIGVSLHSTLLSLFPLFFLLFEKRDTVRRSMETL